MNPDKDIHSMFLRTEETICPPSSLRAGFVSLAPAWCGRRGWQTQDALRTHHPRLRQWILGLIFFILILAFVGAGIDCPFYKWRNRLKIIKKDHAF